MPDFPYGYDVGRNSIAAIETLARSSGVNYTVSDDYRPGDPGYHGKMNAVDMVASTVTMVQLAAYLFQYSAYLLELIHSGGDGYFVKNGKRVDAAFYGDTIVAQHYNHVHCAATISGLTAASTSGKDIIPAGTGDTLKTAAGCLKPAVTTAIITISTLGGIVWTLQPWG